MKLIKQETTPLSSIDWEAMKARIAMENILMVRVAGNKNTNHADIEVGKRIADAVYRRFGVYPGAFQEKHLLWFIDNKVSQLLAGQVLRYWKVISTIALKQGKDRHWAPVLLRAINRQCLAQGWKEVERVIWKRTRPQQAVPAARGSS